MPDIDRSDYDLFDRSTLEAFATCPRQAAYKHDTCRSVDHIANTGTAVHLAISQTVTAYIDSHGSLNRTELVDCVIARLRDSRPDVQPDAITACKASVWAIAKMLVEQHHDNILRYDGGEKELLIDRRGQISHHIDHLRVTVTCELDLLFSTASKSVLDYADYKSGWKHWSEESVKRSFQFQFYPWLILHQYPEVECVRVSIWDLRRNRKTYPIEITRERDMDDIGIRVASAAGYAKRFYGKTPAAVEAWPARDKCSICPAAHMCDALDGDLQEASESPEKMLQILVNLCIKSDDLKKRLKAEVIRTGRDIVLPTGEAFGFSKPTTRKTAVLYGESGDAGDDGDYAAVDSTGEAAPPPTPAPNPFANFTARKNT